MGKERGMSLVAGEILLTSVDKEGTKKGFDIELVKLFQTLFQYLLLHAENMGAPEDFIDVAKLGMHDAAVASMLHYNEYSV